MKKIVFLIACLSAWIACQALAADISWLQVQHRRYAGGKDVNQLGFGLVDERGFYLAGAENVKEVKLYDPSKKEIKLSAVRFDSVEEIYGTYDAKDSQWEYSHQWQYDSWFRADILDSLKPGIYWLKVVTKDGGSSERTFAFNNLVDLPFIDSGSFQLATDSHGNLVWTWTVPPELAHLSLRYKTRARAAIDIFRDGSNSGYFSIIVPVHMSYVLIPRDIAELIQQRGNRFELRVSLETRDKNNRTYSRRLVVDEVLMQGVGK